MGKFYLRVTPKYVIVYETLNNNVINPWYPGMKDENIKVVTKYINKKTQIIDFNKESKVHVSKIHKENINRFLERNKPMEEMKEGVDLVAKLLLDKKKWTGWPFD